MRPPQKLSLNLAPFLLLNPVVLVGWCKMAYASACVRDKLWDASVRALQLCAISWGEWWIRCHLKKSLQDTLVTSRKLVGCFWSWTTMIPWHDYAAKLHYLRANIFSNEIMKLNFMNASIYHHFFTHADISWKIELGHHHSTGNIFTKILAIQRICYWPSISSASLL